MIREFSEIAREYFDISNLKTLRCLTTINEADQVKTMDGLTTELYHAVQRNALKINFETIPDSKGDITKVEGYADMLSCLGIVKNMLTEYRQDLTPVNTVQEAISNIQTRTDLWQRGYQLRVDVPVLLYQTIVLGIYCSVSILIDATIDYIKDAANETYEISFNRTRYIKSKDGQLFRNLKDFNEGCKKGDIDKAVEYQLESNTKNFLGGGTATLMTIAGIAALIHVVIPILREMIYFFFHTKQTISDALIIQSQLIDMNAESLKNNEYSKLSAQEKKKAVKKQKEIADFLHRVGDKFAVTIRTGEKATANSIKAENRKYHVSDVIDSNLDSFDNNDDSLF